MQEVAKEHGIPFKAIHITDKESAQSVPAPVTTYALFRDGRFLTQGIQSDKKFLALAGVRDWAAVYFLIYELMTPDDIQRDIIDKAATEKEFVERVKYYGNHFWLMYAAGFLTGNTNKDGWLYNILFL